MQLAIKEYASFEVAGIAIRTSNANAMETIPPLWERFYKEQLIESIPQKLDDKVLYGVYSHYESDENGDYQLLIGTEVQAGTVIEPPFTSIAIPLSRYIVYHLNNKDEILPAWQKIWSTNLNRTFSMDFERYGPDGIDIYVGIEDDNQDYKATLSGF